jgi:hypothetical protein
LLWMPAFAGMTIIFGFDIPKLRRCPNSGRKR